MRLQDYPNAIAKLQRQIAKSQRELRSLDGELALANSAIESAIAFDDTLTNETKRKAKRSELRANEAYAESVRLCQEKRDEIDDLEIELSLIRNQFSVLKLRKRERIATKELQVVA